MCILWANIQGSNIVFSPGKSLASVMVAIATSVAMVTLRQEYRPLKNTPQHSASALRLKHPNIKFELLLYFESNFFFLVIASRTCVDIASCTCLVFVVVDSWHSIFLALFVTVFVFLSFLRRILYFSHWVVAPCNHCVTCLVLFMFNLYLCLCYKNFLCTMRTTYMIKMNKFREFSFDFSFCELCRH